MTVRRAVAALSKRLGACLLLLGAMLAVANAAKPALQCGEISWPRWSDFKTHFVQPDGRVVDASTPQQHSSSEGQSYAMFFALVANDRVTYDKLWRWSIDNLAGGDISANLPAWFWGRNPEGQWGVLDKNSASDADLWFIYSLLEAGRLWGREDYIRDARSLLKNVEAQEIDELPRLGHMLLPGLQGFVHPDEGLWQLNPSYQPVPVLRRLAMASPRGPWSDIAINQGKMIKAVSPKGFAPDWVSYQAKAGEKAQFIPDPTKGDKGSYDAIRTYLWAGLTSKEDPLAAPMLRELYGMAAATELTGTPPESVDTVTGVTSGVGPFGFSAALLPYLKSLRKNKLLDTQLDRVKTLQRESVQPEKTASQQPSYYDTVLSLFGLGWLENRYQFQRTGLVKLSWNESCRHAVTQ